MVKCSCFLAGAFLYDCFAIDLYLTEWLFIVAALSCILFCFFATMKKILACIFLTLFSFQVLPVKELGKILYKGLMTDEIHEVESSAEDSNNGNWKKLTNYHGANETTTHLRDVYLSSIVHLIITHSAHFNCQYVPEIITPPPNTLV